MAKRASSPDGLPARREYSFEIIDRCEELYVNEEKTYDETSKLTGVSIAQLQRWGDRRKYDWGRKKAEFKQRVMKAQEETRALVREEILLQDLVNQKNLLDKYLEGRDYDRADFNTYSLYRDILNGIAKLLADIRKRDQTVHELQKIDRPSIYLEFMRDLVTFFKDHDPAALEAVEKHFDEYVTWAKEKYAKS